MARREHDDSDDDTPDDAALQRLLRKLARAPCVTPPEVVFPPTKDTGRSGRTMDPKHPGRGDRRG